ncbi:hypothetical protein [Sporosarcina globispora]|nr:hypothetical protein [Sporosarcina globispora]
MFKMKLPEYRDMREDYYLSQGMSVEDAEFEAWGDIVLATQKDEWKL